MTTMIVTGLQVLLVELGGVALMTGFLFLYWNVMTKGKKAVRNNQ